MELMQKKQSNTLSTLEYFTKGKVSKPEEFQRPQDMPPHHKKAAGGQLKTMDLSMGAHKVHHRRQLNLNIYSSRDIEKTK